MSSTELTKWMAFRRVDPRPDIYRAAAVIAYWAAKCHGAEGVDLDTFLLQLPVPESPEERQRRFMIGFKACRKKSNSAG